MRLVICTLLVVLLSSVLAQRFPFLPHEDVLIHPNHTTVSLGASAPAGDMMNNNPNNGQYCINELDDSPLNRCWKHVEDNFWITLANQVAQWVNPRTQGLFVVILVLFLPLFCTKDFFYQRHLLLNYLHRVGYSLVLNVGLYAAFRQSRPCRCGTYGNLQHFGSIYGLPSGDAYAGGVLAAFLFDVAPFNKYVSRIGAVLIAMLVCMERAVLGFHTFTQTAVGTSLAIITHIYSTNAPQYFVFIDTAVQFVLCLALLYADPALKFGYNDSNNLFAWFWWGFSIDIFATLMILVNFVSSGQLSAMKLSLNFLRKRKAEVRLDDPLENIPLVDSKQEKKEAPVQDNRDKIMVVGCVIIMLFFNIFSSLVQQYNWLVPTLSS